MSRVLIIYANTDSVMRKSVAAMLYSFTQYLEGCEVYYHNAIFNRAPVLGMFRAVDYVIFHHSVTTVWDRKRYQSKIDSWLSYSFGSARKIALMQDEYKNVDLLRGFVDSLSIDKVFTLAPPSQWPSIYGQEIIKKGILEQYLAGYLEFAQPNVQSTSPRSLDIGYRSDWSKMHVKLGLTGSLKREIATVVEASAMSAGLKTDIKVGTEHFIRGGDWNLFLQNCRYVIGVPSGSSVLDQYGSIEQQLSDRLKRMPDTGEQQLYDEIVSKEEGSLGLEVLSPRHFEAILNGCGQILVESDYNGVLQPWKHYLPLKRDFSNLDELLGLVADEPLRLEMLENCKRDVLASSRYQYRYFVGSVLPGMDCAQSESMDKSFLIVLNKAIEAAKHLLIVLRAKLHA